MIEHPRAVVAAIVVAAFAIAILHTRQRKRRGSSKPTTPHRCSECADIDVSIMRDLGSKRKCPPFKSAQKAWLEERSRPPVPLMDRVQRAMAANAIANASAVRKVETDDDDGDGHGHQDADVDANKGAGAADQEEETPLVLLQAAWREQRRDPSVALVLAETARRRAKADGAPTEVYQRTAFLCGKILTEAYCDFDTGARLLAESIVGHPTGWPDRQVGLLSSTAVIA